MKKIKRNIYLKIILVTLITLGILYVFLPRILNYPPYSNKTDFQARVDIIPHLVQHILLGVIGIVLYVISISKIFKNIFKYLKTNDKSKLSFDFIKTVRNDCLSIWAKIFILHVLLTILVLIVLFVLMKPSPGLLLKLSLIYLSFFTFIAVISISLIKKDIDTVILSTYEVNSKYSDFRKKQPFYITLMINLLPFFFVLVITIVLLGYSKAASAVGEGCYYYYKIYMDNTDFVGLSVNELVTTLDRIPLKNENDYYFIITDNNQYFSKPNGKVSEFFIKYAKSYLNKTEGRVYEYYGIEEEAFVKEFTLMDGSKMYVGFKYSIVSDAIDTFFLDVTITFSIIYIILLWAWAKNVSKNLIEVSKNLTAISKNKVVNNSHVLPATSADEIGEITIAFNNIQKLTKENVEQIQNDHEKLIERERLASLGQLIGGIAHNLRTPIMSISGATEGLLELIKEYDSSIEDEDVTANDHHEIAKDMKDWIEKIKTYTFYMSEIITTVKGQAVTLSDNQSISFDLEELVKRVEILMKHELKHALINFNVSINTDPHTVLYGNIVSLVQVINNMISNSIHAYNGEHNKDIDLVISRNNDDIIISITDYASGIPHEIQKKLFKEMITTKGKNGTGLGLYMSYSNIKAHFHGNITFESHTNEGTTFNIILPINKA